MPIFAYSARDQKGGMQSGQLEGVDEDQVVAMLQHRGLLVTSIRPKDLVQERQTSQAAATRKRRQKMHTGVKTADHVMLCDQLATLVDAGIPLLKGLEVVSAQVESRVLLLALEQVRHDVEAGGTLRDALAKHPAIFSNLWLNLVETGEASGHLAQSLRQLGKHFESAQHLQSEAQTAMTYPAFLICAALGVLALFVYWLIPKFTGMFKDMGMELPLLTRIVIGISDASRKYWVAIIGAVVGAAFLLRQYLRTEAGQWTRDRLLVRMPLFGQLVVYLQMAQFGQGLGTLLQSGVPLLSALEILENSSTNKVFGQAIGEVREAVKEGKSMAQPLDRSGLFPPMVVQLVQVGEEVGELAKMAGRFAAYYEEKVETFIARMTRLFEPIAIVVMGALVLIIVLSIFMPILQMSSGKGMKIGGP